MELSDYKSVWQRVRETYGKGYCIYERGLQALLYKELSVEFPEKNIVVEPRWDQDGKTYIPDLVMICEHEISDIFEIKFCPWWYPNYKIDEKKLLEYGGEHDVRLKNPYSVDPDNVLYDQMQISKNCKRHFVAVGRSNSDAVMPKNISRDIIHWYGKIEQSPEDNCWDISRGEGGVS